MKRVVFFICCFFLCSTLSWGQTWTLSATMKATLNNGTMTVSTTADAEAMPDFEWEYGRPTTPWYNDRDKILSVVIEANVTTVGVFSFYECINLSTVTIPNSVTRIGISAFIFDKKLTSITLPGSITIIEGNAFSNGGLTSVTIPGSVTSIGSFSFGNCDDLKEVSVEWATPLIDVNYYAFYNISATLRVPTGTKALYQAAKVWEEFETFVEYNAVGIEQFEIQTLKVSASNGVLYISGLQSGKTVSIYNVSGQLVFQGIANAETEQISLNKHGIYFVMSGNQTIKTIVK